MIFLIKMILNRTLSTLSILTSVSSSAKYIFELIPYLFHSVFYAIIVGSSLNFEFIHLIDQF